MNHQNLRGLQRGPVQRPAGKNPHWSRLQSWTPFQRDQTGHSWLHTKGRSKCSDLQDDAASTCEASTLTFRVWRRSTARPTEEKFFLSCSGLTSRGRKQVVEEIAVAGSSFESSLASLVRSRGDRGRGRRFGVGVQPQEVSGVTGRGLLRRRWTRLGKGKTTHK